MKTRRKKENRDPNQLPITGLQAKRLANLTNINEEELKGQTIVELSEKYKFRIDPKLLCLRRICGKVVKKDPVTGELFPVPFATVHVEDTDCHLLGYFPPGWPWIWFFPFHCHREEITTVKTDECGRFCVYIPCWEIDWILRWRRARICFPYIFVKPTIRDILEEILPDPPIIRRPRPEPDPIPFKLQNIGKVQQQIEELIGKERFEQLVEAESVVEFGAPTSPAEALLNQPALGQAFPPPITDEVKHLFDSENADVIAKQFSIGGGFRPSINTQNFIGPFRRCVDVFFPLWQAITDVPDITFRVTQDVDGDGNEETIYSENFFDVRWDAVNIPDVTLEADPIAIAGVTCNSPSIPCEDTPAILFAGLMPLVNPPAPTEPYHNASTGYARRPNRSHRSGQFTLQPTDFPLGLSQAPYAKTLQLYGCSEIDGASYYRLKYQFNGGPAVPFTGLTWPVHRLVSGSLQTLWPSSDANGWYPVLPATEGWSPNQLLLNWPTVSFNNGRYTVTLEVANATKAVIDTSAPVNLRIDNSVPIVEFTELRWRVVGGVWSAPLHLICPIIHRPMVGGKPVDIEISVSYRVSATHLRSTNLYGGGCGDGRPILISPLSTAQHWHTSPSDNTVINTGIFSIVGTNDPGAYSFHLHATSRAFNPSGGDSGLALDWNYNPVYKWIRPRLAFAVVDA